MSKPIELVLWQAWKMLNAVNAQYGHERLGYSEEYWDEVREDCKAAYTEITGKPIEPWPPKPLESAGDRE